MSERDELERRLVDALRALPAPHADAEARARRAALGTLAPAAAPPMPPARRRWRRGGMMAAAAAATVTLTAGLALAATGNLDVRVGGAEPAAAPASAPPPERITLAEPLRGLAVLSGGDAVVTERRGFLLEARASAIELSPNALYVAAGLGRSLVALAPNGREAWSHDAGGPVVAAVWAPNPLPTEIAFIVRRPSGHELWLIEGNGRNPRRIDTDVAPVRPTWRADFLALAYVGADGRLRIRDRFRGETLAPHACLGDIAALAYAPAGGRLALVGARGRVGVLDLPGGVPGGTCLPALKGPELTDVAWISPTDLITAERAGPRGGDARLRRFATGPGGIAPGGALTAAGADLLALAPLPPRADARGLAVLARPAGAPGRLAVWLTDAPPAMGERPLSPRATVARLAAGPGPRTLSAQ